MDGKLRNASQGQPDSLVQRAMQMADEAWAYDRENRVEALQDLLFIAGQQWDAKEKKLREEDDRPCLTINRLIGPVKQVVNDIRAAVPAVKVMPIGNGADEGMAAVHAGLARYIQRKSNATWAYAQATGHAAMCGIGHFRFNTGYLDDSFDQEVTIELIPHPLSVLWDPAAKKPDRSDAKFCFVLDFIPEEQFKERYPEATMTSFTAANLTTDRQFKWLGKSHIVVAELWEKTPEEQTILELEDGRIINATNIAMLPGVRVVRERKQIRHRVEQTLINGLEPLSETMRWPGMYIPIIPVLGNEVPLEQEVVRHGMVRFARDPQRMYNYWRSAAAEWIGQGAKTPYLATTNMIGPYKEMWETANTTPRPVLLYDIDKDNPQAMPSRNPPPSPPDAFWTEGQFTADEIKQTTGIFDASLGARSNEVSGKAIRARQAEGDMANFEFGDNLRISLQHAGNVLVDLQSQVYDGTRTVQILDEEELEKAIPVNLPAMDDFGNTVYVNDLAAGRYSMTITVGPSQMTRRQEGAESMMEFANTAPQVVSVGADIIADAMDWPGKDKLVRRLRRAMDPNLLDENERKDLMPPSEPSQEQLEAMQLELDKLAAEIEKMRADARLSQAKAEREEVEATMAQIGGRK